jgi:O-antigen ligase
VPGFVTAAEQKPEDTNMQSYPKGSNVVSGPIRSVRGQTAAAGVSRSPQPMKDFAVSRRHAIASQRTPKRRLAFPVYLFFIGLVVPWVISIGPLRMSVYRFALLLMVLPCLAMWLSGKAGRIRIADILLLLFSFWCALSFTVLHGAAIALEPSGIVFVETIGAYLLGRCYIRSADDFHNAIKVLFAIVVVLLPFAMFEFVSGQNISRELFAQIWPTRSDPPEPGRLGLTRVQAVFDHPILFGVFAGSIFALAHVVLGFRKSFFDRCLKTGIVGLTSFLSLSAGPVLVVIVQGALLSWNGLLRGVQARWKILIGLVTLLVASVELVANRSLPAIVSSYFAFDVQSYWYRMLIWSYGSAAALNHPLFGVGLYDWDRPEWMPPSIDNVWLFFAIRYGLPGAALMLLFLVAVVLPISAKKGLNERQLEYRTGFLIMIAAFFLVGWTVHFWDAAYVLFLFLVGSGVWMLDVRTTSKAVSSAKHFEAAGSGTRSPGSRHGPRNPAPTTPHPGPYVAESTT